MFFFPYRVDLALGRLPVITILICLLCIFTFWRQAASEHTLQQQVMQYCQAQDDYSFRQALTRIRSRELPDCTSLMLWIHNSQDPAAQIEKLVLHTAPGSSIHAFRTQTWLRTVLNERYQDIARRLPANMTTRLAYYPHSLKVHNMITTVFAHGDIMHLLGNLLFFFAFAASIEAVLGVLRYTAIFVALCLIVALSYSASAWSGANIPTIGLSGVVMGMIGLFSYLMPSANMRCLFVFFFYIRTWLIPAWLLATWYVGWDVYALFVLREQTNVNLVAHVSGAAGGYLLGLILFRQQKARIRKYLHRVQRA